MPKPKVLSPKEASSPRPTWSAVEDGILTDWQRDDVLAQVLKRPAPKGNFVFYEGPPTANAAPGVHHVLARVFKDLIVRFATMRGYHVERKAGWDTHGLPVELQVEKAHGFTSKADIERYGIAKFNAECRELVWRHKDDWEKLTQRIGFWLDLKNPYITYENSYIESVWAVIARAHERGLLYQGHKVVPYCTRCGTALSSHEVAQGYREVTEDSVYVKCRVTQGNNFVKPGDFILTWTTTPWTLPGNVALAVGPEIIYVRVKRFTGKWDSKGKAIYDIVILAKEIYRQLGDDPALLIAEPFYFLLIETPEGHEIPQGSTILQEFRGKDLVGVSYEPLFTGAVDVANAKTAFSVVPADFVTTTDGTGVVHTAVMYGEDDYQLGEAVGLPKHHTVGLDGKFLPHVKGLAGMYVKNPETQEKIFKLLGDAVLAVTKYKHDYPFCWRCDTPLLYYAKDSWFIAMTKVKNELLKNAQEITWVPEYIKEGRFGEWLANVKDWAISRERYWGSPLPVWVCQGCKHWEVVGSIAELEKKSGKKLDDLHRPFIDDVTWPCETCSGTMHRVSEVMDVWLDSGSMPFAQYHYPFEHKALIEGKDGQFPADYICEAIDQTRGWFYTLLAVSTIMGKGMSYRNVICLGHINDAQGRKMSKSKGNIVNPWDVIKQFGVDPLRWYFYTVNQPGEPKNFDPVQIEEVNKKVFMILRNVVSFYSLFDDKKKIVGQPPLVKHVEDQWLLSSLHRLGEAVSVGLEKYDIVGTARAISSFINELSTRYIQDSRGRFKDGDDIAKATLGYTLQYLARLMAPYTPFFAEWMYREIGGKKESIHLESWPLAGQIDVRVLENMEYAYKYIERGLAKRMESNIKVRQPLSKGTLFGPALSKEYSSLIKSKLNINELDFSEKNNRNESFTVELDTTITNELRLAGHVREITRYLNALRKDEKYSIHDKINIFWNTLDNELSSAIEMNKDEILKKTNAKKIEKSSKNMKENSINGIKVFLGILKD